MPHSRDETEDVVDLRRMPCVLRHAAILDLFDALQPGGSFVVVNDRDPAPIRRHFESRAACGYEWTYLGRGPGDWRIRITRR
jgi:uncharacterized protein (DUF2249 family)